MSELTRAQYSILAELKRIDDKLSRVQRDMETIPTQTQKLESTLSGHRAEYEKVKGVADTHEKSLRDAERDLKEKEEFLRKAESKMMEVKTNEEYQAAMKENESHKKEKASIEERILKLMSDAEEKRNALAEAEKKFKEYEAITKAEQKTLDEEKKKLNQLYEEVISKRTNLATQLSPEIATIYQRLCTKTKGVGAVAHVENGLCLACNMKIRPQLYNEVLGFKSVHQCPSCSRILIVASAQTDSSNDQKLA